MRLIVLDAFSSLPEGEARLAERLWLQTQLRLEDRANDEAPFVKELLRTRHISKTLHDGASKRRKYAGGR